MHNLLSEFVMQITTSSSIEKENLWLILETTILNFGKRKRVLLMYLIKIVAILNAFYEFINDRCEHPNHIDA